MLKSKKWTLLAGFMIVSLILAACAQQKPVEVPVTVVVKQTEIVAGTSVVKEVSVTATPVPAETRDTIIIGTWQQPRSFLDYANSQAIQVEIQLIFKPRFVTRVNFGYQPNPVLVDGDLPTFDNGGAVLNDLDVKAGDPYFNPETFIVEPAQADTKAKQLVVTGKIKAGLKWDDGQPLTAKDFVFAFNMNCSKDSEAIDISYCPLGSVAGATGLLTKYEAKDDTTLVATFTPGVLDPTYQLVVFGPEGWPQPEHLFTGKSAVDLLSDEHATGGENAVPLGFGPYKMKEWKKGDHVSFEPNPTWPGPAPKTPNIIYRFFSDSTALAAAVIAGDIDSTSGITGLAVDQAPYMESVAKQGLINYSTDPNAASFEMLYINYNDPTDPNFKKADAAGEKPHPVLSDYAVRKAIAEALDRKKMVDTIYYGQSSVVEQPQLPQMVSYDPSLGTIAYNPDDAKKILDDAGWKPGDDGVRVKNGVRASINYLTTSGNAPRQKASQVLQANLKEIGIEVKLTYQPSSVVFSGDGLYGRNFDLIQFANVFSVVDPGSWLFGVANCGQILTGANGFGGSNFAGWCNKEASDDSAKAAYLTLDPKERKAAWDVVIKDYFAPPTGDDYRTGGYPVIPLYTRPDYLATVPGLQGAKLDPTEYFTWNVETWTLTGK